MRLPNALIATAAFVLALEPAQAREPWVRNTIYFDQNTVELGIVPREIISDLAADAIKEGAPKIIVVGHCDTADNAPTVLSRYRANAVADVFRAKGIPADVVIEVLGAGTSNQAVKTGPNIREPYNRRATIAF